eukprot:10717869-Ditylum_brightwellii.AAC.1
MTSFNFYHCSCHHLLPGSSARQNEQYVMTGFDFHHHSCHHPFSGSSARQKEPSPWCYSGGTVIPWNSWSNIEKKLHTFPTV